jgi:hypothetical protein
MDTSKLHQLQDRSQIIEAIEKGTLFGGDIWQTPHRGERKVFQIIQIHLDTKYDKMIFRILGHANFDPTRPLYVRLSYRNLIFRLMPSEFKMVADKLICRYPREARALEERKGERYVLPFNSDISLSLKRVERTVRDTAQEIELKIIDVSERGFGILLSSTNKDFLRKDDHFWIKAIDNKQLRHHIFGTVTYVAPKGYYLKKGHVRVGLALGISIVPEIFEHLKKRCLVVMSA